MRRPTFYRLLNRPERLLAEYVFENTIPPTVQIGIGNGLGLNDRPWTDSGHTDYSLTPDIRYQINIGDFASYDLTSGDGTDGFGRVRELFIHEMVHVWQYYNGFGVWLSSAWASTLGSYKFTAGDSWNSYNVEQQAEIVETWFRETWKTSVAPEDHQLYPYVQAIIRKGGKDWLNRELTLDALRGTEEARPPLKSVEKASPPPYKISQSEARPPLTDALLIGILEQRFAATDVAGFGGRVKRLEQIFGTLSRVEAVPLLTRLELRPAGDKVATYFHSHLSTPTKTNLLQILRKRLTS